MSTNQPASAPRITEQYSPEYLSQAIEPLGSKLWVILINTSDNFALRQSISYGRVSAGFMAPYLTEEELQRLSTGNPSPEEVEALYEEIVEPKAQAAELILDNHPGTLEFTDEAYHLTRDTLALLRCNFPKDGEAVENWRQESLERLLERRVRMEILLETIDISHPVWLTNVNLATGEYQATPITVDREEVLCLYDRIILDLGGTQEMISATMIPQEQNP